MNAFAVLIQLALRYTTKQYVDATVRSAMTPRRLEGVSLIELLVVIAILGLLVQLMLPAVLASREAANQLACTNNLRQVVLAMHAHHDTKRRLPSGGWHYMWAGEPELGTGREQPGGWIFNLLDYLEQNELRQLGAGLNGADRAAAFKRRFETPVAVFSCPSRRTASAYMMDPAMRYYSRDGMLADTFDSGARTDFAACVGSSTTTTDYFEFEQDGWSMPALIEEGNSAEFLWPTDPEFETKFGQGLVFDGLIYGRSEVRFDQVTDGLSKTYLIGEKYLAVERYENGLDPGDHEHMYAGFNDDTQRSASLLPVQDTTVDYHQDQFGACHPTSWNMAFADGSIRPMSYDVFLEVHRRLGSRDDGKPVQPHDF
jgi:prepilin-type N-terminal cleavage/methylation domain-containing protein